MTAARTASEEILEAQAAADPAYRKLYEGWKKARSESFRWFDTAEAAYASFAFPRG